MRTPIVAGNWKMNLTISDASTLIEGLTAQVADMTGVEIAVCPPFTALHAVGQALQGSPIALGGQDCYPEESGAYTGEVSPQMLLDVGCTWTLIGHSERRQHFDESDDYLNRKLKFALKAGLKVMFCIGETLEERESDEMENVLRRQIRGGLDGLSDSDFERIVVAYEPVWAIGTGLTATPEQADEAHAFIREVVSQQFSETISAGLRIQYGGSVNAQNAAELMAKNNVDGALVGGASLKADSFAAIVAASAHAAQPAG